MSYTLVEQVKIRLKQFHIEEVEDETTGEKSDKVVFDEKEWNNVTCSATGADTVYRMRRKESASKGREWVSDRG